MSHVREKRSQQYFGKVYVRAAWNMGLEVVSSQDLSLNRHERTWLVDISRHKVLVSDPVLA